MLTEKGRDLLPVMAAARQWGMANRDDGSPWGAERVERNTGRIVRGVSLQAGDGSSVDPSTVEPRTSPAADASVPGKSNHATPT